MRLASQSASSSKFDGSMPAHTPADMHRRLLEYGRQRLLPALPGQGFELGDPSYSRLQRLELAFLATERKTVAAQAASCPRDATAFVRWFETLKETGPGQNDSLFPWLAQSASMEQMRWFIAQEVAGEAGFEDLIALTQLRMPTQAKLEMARNYWDEMGRGAEPGMHGPMLAASAQELGIEPDPNRGLVWEALALGNLMMGMAYNRQYAYHSAGALGAIELTSPTRVGYVAEGLRRLGVSKRGTVYFSLHASVDVRHSADWNREVIYSLVRDRPEVAPAIAEGALMRLNAGARCFARYRREFRLPASHPTRVN